MPTSFRSRITSASNALFPRRNGSNPPLSRPSASLAMNRTPSSRPSPPVGEKVPGGRLRGIPTGSWLRFTSGFIILTARWRVKSKDGRGGEIRTHDLLYPKQVMASFPRCSLLHLVRCSCLYLYVDSPCLQALYRIYGQLSARKVVRICVAVRNLCEAGIVCEICA